MKLKEARKIREQMQNTFALAAPGMTNDQVIENRLMCKAWKTGSHTTGEVYTAGGQVWQCIQDYDNSVYPDIVPGGSAWGTFHKSYHGTTVETAMPWAEPAGAHDMYLAGEYMIWTDGTVYQCISGTVYSPADYPDAWVQAE